MDGIKFGPLSNGTTFEEVMCDARTKGFGELIKRRFVIGSFALMKENQNDLFKRAQKNRRRIVEAVNNILKDSDFIYLPAAPGPYAGHRSSVRSSLSPPSKTTARRSPYRCQNCIREF